ncbi:HlyD family secretion protein [Hwanghaeella grinnelliae]|uniref:HlyD family secretion protein n=1 Tax=Hwanghaeella grinnelliae TaxID=2500179 RepID=A0A3S2WC15_9PROT|nr:HlyD family secretion protein [Hwanghaeella grinnelliae]RVU38968.1 HlyD family secretion protein [Hwanghaeella grinnelliae]
MNSTPPKTVAKTEDQLSRPHPTLTAEERHPVQPEAEHSAVWSRRAEGLKETVPPAPMERPPADTTPTGEATSPAQNQAGSSAKPPDEAETAKKKASPLRKGIRLLVLAALLCVGGYEGHSWWTVGRFIESTDDAYVGADMSVLSSKVTGYVDAVPVRENQSVQAGDVIARIEDGDYRLAVQAVEDKIAVQQATVARIDVQTIAAQSVVREAMAGIESAKAELDRANAAYQRQAKLAKTNFASRQAEDDALAARDKARAALNAARAQHATAQADISVFDAQRVEAERSLNGLQTELAQTRRDLQYTVIHAPVDGVVGNKSVEVGQLVQPGTRLAAIVPLRDIHIDANFKETQLAGLRPGTPVDITVDAYPDRVFKGAVESISPASGSLFSLLPPENATGNFTKIVQRLPVRIRLIPDGNDGSEGKGSEAVLRPGMSVEVSFDSRGGE